MKFSDRIYALKGAGSFEIMARAQELERQGSQIIHFEIGQPDFPTPPNIVEAGIKALRDGKTKYVSTLGIPPLRSAIADQINRTYGASISGEGVAVLPGTKMALYLAMASAINPGDEVIYPDPSFYTYEALVGYFGGVKKPVPLLESKGFSFDLDALRSVISEKTRIIVLNSPSNPTGGVMSKGEVDALADILRKHPRCFVLSDEIYSRMIYGGHAHASIFSHEDLRGRIFIADGFSKTYAMTGWRLGYLIFPSALRIQIDHLVTNTVSCAAAFTQYAGLEALTGPQDSVQAMISEFEKRRDIVVDGLRTISGLTCHTPDGAFYAFPNVQAFSQSSAEIASRLLEESGVALLDGAQFGKFGSGYLRLSYATPIPVIEEGLRRMKKMLEELPKKNPN